MSLITHRTTYAERILTYISKSEKELVSSSEIIEHLNTPKAITRQILLVLQKEGILKSIKGSKGGFKLANPADQTSLYDLIQIFQGDLEYIDCLTGKLDCDCIDDCRLKNELKDIQNYVKNRLSKLKIKNY